MKFLFQFFSIVGFEYQSSLIIFLCFGIAQIFHAFGTCIKTTIRQQIKPRIFSEYIAIQKGFACLMIHKLKPASRACRNQIFAVRRKSDGINPSRMSFRNIQAFSGFSIPDADSMIAASGGYIFSVRGKIFFSV